MNENIFIKQLEKLVSFETITGNAGENKKALDYVVSLLNPKAFIKRVKINNCEVLVAGNTKSMSPDVGFLVHMDVVFAKPEQFNMKKKGDKLIGRGTSDMKFSIPMGIELLNNLIIKKSKLSFSLAITTDEETGGDDSCSYLAEKLKFRPSCMIVPDGGENLTFVSKSKGVCWLSITSKGTPAHASRPWKGKNALEPLIILADKLIKEFGKNSLKENWETTMNIGQIVGGVSVNQICPEAIMKLDFRFPESNSSEKIVDKVKKYAKNISPDLKVIVDSTTFPTFTDTNLDIVKNFISSIGKAYSQKIIISKAYGASDASHFAKYNIPILMMEPIGGGMHSQDEWLSISSCLKFFDGLTIFLEMIEKSLNI